MKTVSKSSKSIFAVLAAGIISCGLFAGAAQAVPLTAGGTLFPLVIEPGEPSAGAVLVGSLTAPYIGGSISGTVDSYVYRGDTTNPYGITSLTFVYHINNFGPDAVSSLSPGGFTGLLTDVGQHALGTKASFAARSSDGNIVSFGFLGAGAVQHGTHSMFLVIQTNYTTFTTATAGISDASGTTVAVLSPGLFPRVPDGGSTVTLLGLAFIGIGVVRRKFTSA